MRQGFSPLRRRWSSGRVTRACSTALFTASLMTLFMTLWLCLAEDAAQAQSPAGGTLEAQLLAESPDKLAQAARVEGDSQRGAVLFHQPQSACAKCHLFGTSARPSQSGQSSGLGPDLTKLEKDASDAAIVESILLPSKQIRAGFAATTLVLEDGRVLQGVVASRDQQSVVLRDAAKLGAEVVVPLKAIDEEKTGSQSLMPAGQVNQLASRQQFLDLVRYVLDVRDGGLERARQLQPPASLLAFTLPEYETRLDHAGLIRSWNEASRQRGEKLYQRVCVNCHGTKELAGSLPTSLRFAEGKFKNGSDPLAMYRTLTHGFGLMAPQTWMVPQQKYDVIHYIREAYLKPHNPTQYTTVDAAYLAALPKGDTRGPAPSNIEPWVVMDYGPSLIHTYELPSASKAPRPNIAYKGVAVRLDPGPGGVSRGAHWMIFDHDTMRAAGAWSAPAGKAESRFIDWAGIQFDGRHGVHPRVVGELAWTNPVGPGWGRPEDGSFADDQRVVGRDGRTYGPLPRSWAHFRGVYHHGLKTVLSYDLDSDCPVLELPRLGQWADGTADARPLFARQFQIGPRRRELVLNVAQLGTNEGLSLAPLDDVRRGVVLVGASHSQPRAADAAASEKRRWRWDGAAYAEVDGAAFDWHSADFSLAARVRTREGGTILALAPAGDRWAPNGQTWFIRDGRLGFDIGWVGAVVAKRKIDDGAWHDVGLSWSKRDGRVRLYVDGKLDGEGTLRAPAPLENARLRIGFTSPDFPRPRSHYVGELDDVRFYQRQIEADEWRKELPTSAPELQGRWRWEQALEATWPDASGREHTAKVHRGEAARGAAEAERLLAGIEPSTTPVRWEWLAAEGQLRLHIPAGEQPLRFTLWTTRPNTADVGAARALAERVVLPDADADLTPLTLGGPPRWPQTLQTEALIGADEGPLSVDVLAHPQNNPWFAQLRFTGFDFLPGGDRIAICTWDGDVWIVTQKGASLAWRRIATGLFQPLGLKYLHDRIHVTCRDQLVVLHDVNGDGEIDFYESLNNDHQVTEHFHEFAMGLQTDAAGNFYYAKSARHALPAVVPHHGTLLRVSPDGQRTDILATGFRAANGVCLNPDGTFIVTDQEGHWNPKNRINWVDGKGPQEFYGNLFGYHEVTDESDEAMRPPLCWITNAFDRSPAELLWTPMDAWGSLGGSLLNLSYGYGKIFVVPHEQVGGVRQGGMCELPLPIFPTGLIRGRFHPQDKQLYACGMFSWAGSATQPGGFYRIRATGKPMYVPREIHAQQGRLTLGFTGELDSEAVQDLSRYELKVWGLKRTANYGSKHYDERPLSVASAQLSSDRRTLLLEVPDLAPTWGMEIKYRLKAASGEPVVGVVHNTIHVLGPRK
ncbi:MAG: DUF6797 domain-containing protein [Pirellulales bacterium]